MSNEAFYPEPDTTVSRAYSSATSRVALARAAINCSVRLFNDGAQKVFVRFGTDNTVNAALTDVPLAPGAVEVFKVQGNMTYLAAISASGTGTLYATLGEGV